jgi:hypothetical protein
MKPLVERAFQKEAAHSSLLNPQAIAEVWKRFLAGQTSWSRPWSLFVLQRWCEQNL